MDGTGHPEMFWEVVTSMWIGNAMLLVINLLLIGLWGRLLQVPYRLRFPAIVLLCCIGMYSVNNQPGDIVQVGVFGLIGYLCCKLRNRRRCFWASFLVP